MEHHKKLGTIVMAIALVLVLACFVFTSNGCYPGSPADESIFRSFITCWRIAIYEDIPGNEFADHLYLPTKYAVLACSIIFAVGGLWYRDALPIPAILKNLWLPKAVE